MNVYIYFYFFLCILKLVYQMHYFTLLLHLIIYLGNLFIQ